MTGTTTHQLHAVQLSNHLDPFHPLFLHTLFPLHFCPHENFLQNFFENFEKSTYCSKTSSATPRRSIHSLARNKLPAQQQKFSLLKPIMKPQNSNLAFRSPIQQHCSFSNAIDNQSNNLIARKINSRPKCSICGISGHNSRTCKENKINALKFESVNHVLNSCFLESNNVEVRAINHNVKSSEVLLSENLHLSNNRENSSFSHNSNFNVNTCPFCQKAISEVNQGRPVLFCRSCKAQDTLRPPVKIPVEVSPASSIPLSIELRSFTSKLKKNEWDVSSFWKFFAKKKSFVNKNAVYKQNPIPKVQQLRKLCLRGRYGAGVQSLFSPDIAKPTLETVEKLKKLHPEENFICLKPNIC
ncbi:hypothetical protein P9112_008339 [Eukaryota sp. TZLM1-RC]